MFAINLKNIIKARIFVSVLLFTLGCGPGGFKGTDIGLQCDGNGQNCTYVDESGQRQQASSGITPPDPWKKIEGELTGHVTSGENADEKVISVDRNRRLLIMRIPLRGQSVEESSSKISEVPGVQVFSGNNSGGEGEIELEIPLASLINETSLGNPSRLPNGDPLPSVPGGELPSLSIEIPEISMSITLYLGANVVGLYISAQSDPASNTTVPVRTKKEDGEQQRIIGYLSALREKNGSPAGLFLVTIVPSDIAQLLKEVM